MLKAIDLASGVQSATNAAGVATLATCGPDRYLPSRPVQSPLKTSTGGDLEVSGKADFLKALGLTTALGSRHLPRSAPPARPALPRSAT